MSRMNHLIYLHS